KVPWPTFRDLNAHLRGDFRDPRVVYEHSPDHEALGTVRAFEDLPLFSGRSTLEGLYMQASPSAPFVFYVQSEVSNVNSCPFPDPPALQERMETDRITVTGCRPGHPVLIRISYHPRWKVTTGERVWLAAPSFMLVVPKGERIELYFAGGWPVTLGHLLTAAG